MKYNVFLDNESLTLTCGDKIILTGITLKCSFSRTLGVEFVPSEIERNENTIKVAFKRK